MRNTAARAFERLKIPAGNRALLCLDGGGIRGIMTLQLLKALEEEAGCPCHQIFDMVAGTSTGGIIAGLIASGRTAAEIERLYQGLVRRVFTRRTLGHRFANPPAWSKHEYRTLLKETLGNVTLHDVCSSADLDLLITAHDVVEGEETYFAYVRGRPTAENAYATVLLRAALEATMSAPTYFHPFERFVDGGTTTFNNPALAAIIEAVEYGGNAYDIEHLSVFSFGTGCQTHFVKPEQAANPPGLDALFWLKWLMVEAGNDASDMQSYLLRSRRLLPGCDYRRFQISLDRAAIARLPNIALDGARTIQGLSDEELSAIDLDSFRELHVMQAIGEGMVNYLRQRAAEHGHALFEHDLVDTTDPAGRGHELLVTRAGEVARIRAQLSDPEWVDSQVP